MNILGIKPLKISSQDIMDDSIDVINIHFPIVVSIAWNIRYNLNNILKLTPTISIAVCIYTTLGHI